MGGVESCAADEMGGAGDLEIKFGSDSVEDFESDVHDFGADSVAGENSDGVRHGWCLGRGGGMLNS